MCNILICEKDNQKNVNKTNQEYQEQRKYSGFSSSAYKAYFNGLFGLFTPILVLALFFVSQTLVIITDYIPFSW